MTGQQKSTDVAESLTALFGLHGRAVIVTGAGRGLGREIALAVATAGGAVVGVSRTPSELQETAALAPSGRFFPMPWDVTKLDEADALIERAGGLASPIYGIVHAAGVQHRVPAVDVSVADFHRVTTLNLDAPFFLSTALHRRQLREDRVGSHIFIGSLTSHLGISGISAYAASKSGIVGVVRTLAVEWAEAGARVNAVCPGYFRTALTEELFADPRRSAWVHSRIPMGRLGVGADLAGAVVYLLSDAAGYVTGQLINVDGGWLAG
jgi:NAD(P)-dependent dehydrogenase (short-subunit alcohol dehydrogenase family)